MYHHREAIKLKLTYNYDARERAHDFVTLKVIFQQNIVIVIPSELLVTSVARDFKKNAHLENHSTVPDHTMWHEHSLLLSLFRTFVCLTHFSHYTRPVSCLFEQN